jgi:cell division protein FtsL
VNTQLRAGGSLQRALVATAIGVLLGAGALVWTRTAILSLQYQLARLVDREAELRGEVEKLEIEVAALSAPARVEREARALGLREPQPGQVLRVATGDGAAGGAAR